MKSFRLLLVLCILILSTLTTSLIVAQDDPLAPFSANTCQQNENEFHQQLTLHYRDNAKLSDYNVVYFVAPDVLATDDLLSPENVQKTVKDVKVITNWEDFLAFDEATPIDSVFIHKSAYDLADKEWFHHAHRNAVGIITINITFGERAELLGDYCKFKKYAPEGPAGGNPMKLTPENYYIQTQWIMTPVDDSQREAIYTRKLTVCQATDDTKTAGFSVSATEAIGAIDVEVNSLQEDFFMMGLMAMNVDIEKSLTEFRAYQQAHCTASAQ